MAFSRDNIVWWNLGGILLGVLLGLLLGTGWAGLLILAVLGGLAGLGAWMSYTDSQTLIVAGETSLSAAEVRAIARDVLLDRPGWRQKREEPNEFSVERSMPANPGAVILFLLLGVIPVVAYLLLIRNRYQRVAILTTPGRTTRIEVRVQPKGADGRRITNALYRQIDERATGQGAASPVGAVPA